MENNEKKVLLSLKHVDVKFNVRGRILSAIRDVSLDIYENESIAIVGESGSGKSVLTKTFAGMLDSNGFISHGSIIFSDDELSKTEMYMDWFDKKLYQFIIKKLNKHAHLSVASSEYNKINELREKIVALTALSEEEEESYEAKIKDIKDDLVDANNFLQTLDKRDKEDQPKIVETKAQIAELSIKLKEATDELKNLVKSRKDAVKADPTTLDAYLDEIKELQNTWKEKVQASEEKGLSEEVLTLNELIAKEIMLSIGRYPVKDELKYTFKLIKGFKQAYSKGIDVANEKYRNRVFEPVVFRVKYLETLEDGTLSGYAIIDCAKVKFTKDWQKIRGCRIATVFQDPMTSLNPIVPIGKQIMTVILKHQNCTYDEAKRRALDIMDKVGIPDPHKRFNDYPFQYSGGMRQRIVIAIALSCQPKILICDEPTTALDVTIQAQIIRLIKKLQKELGFTTVYITHDLGVVANVAERVAVLYGGQIQEIGTVEDIFYRPAHPYTWALLSSLPQLSERGKELFSIPGTPPSLYNKIIGDSFAPRNKYCMAIDLVKEPPMFKISDTHYAKTWLLDPRSPKVEMPENIQNLHEKILKTYIKIEE